MNTGTYLRYATAIATVLLGTANSLFGAHFAIPTIVGDFSVGITLIVAEIIALHKKDWKDAFGDLEKLVPIITSVVHQILAGSPKGLSMSDVKAAVEEELAKQAHA